MKNDKGLTLVELLAVITLSALIMVTIFSLVKQSQAEHANQVENSQQLSKNTFILKQLTADIRESTNLSQNVDEVILKKPAGITTTYTFDRTQNTLYRNGQILGSDLRSFELIILGNSIKIQLENLNNELLSTTIFIRGD